ncbi:hypothetical protein O972_23200 [Mycobacterium avium subsp. avium 10-9275]|nr:hypothetical protein P863_21270 [Mycobacterium avium subsp. silvaticum ATCC 49884]ETB11356.1 hypothetical protein O972_23200 [Mycobacterium avium subsp. avium 10-9275]
MLYSLMIVFIQESPVDKFLDASLLAFRCQEQELGLTAWVAEPWRSDGEFDVPAWREANRCVHFVRVQRLIEAGVGQRTPLIWGAFEG